MFLEEYFPCFNSETYRIIRRDNRYFLQAIITIEKNDITEQDRYHYFFTVISFFVSNACSKFFGILTPLSILIFTSSILIP